MTSTTLFPNARVIALLILLSACPVRASTTYDYRGVIDIATGDFSKLVGERINGKIVYPTDVLPPAGETEAATYTFREGQASWSLAAPGLSFSSSDSVWDAVGITENISIAVYNNNANRDGFMFDWGGASPNFRLFIEDSSQSVYSNIELPSTFDLALFDIGTTSDHPLSEFTTPTGSMLTFHLTYLQPVPLPSTAVQMGLGLTILVSCCRNRIRRL